VLTFFGFMHGEAIGIGESPVVALSYLLVAGALAGCARFAQVPAAVLEPVPHHEVQLAAAGGE
jgi:AGZA family xanthine/uracil permease-like MFS transporter